MNFLHKRFLNLKVLEWLHHLYVLLALGAMVFTALNVNTDKELVLLTGLIIYLIITFIGLLYISISHGRKARYAEAMPLLHKTQDGIRDLHLYLTWCLDEKKDKTHFQTSHFIDVLERHISNLCEAYTLVSGTSCSVSIKLIGTTNKSDVENSTLEELYASTLVRDLKSKAQYEEIDAEEGGKHKISDNTDYKRIINNSCHYYFDGNLSSQHHVHHTTYADDGCSHGNLRGISEGNKSTIVFPIRYKYSSSDIKDYDADQTKKGLFSQHTLLGYLTVDSQARNAFVERYDVDLGASVSDSLFSLLLTYNKVKQSIKEKD